MGREYPVRSTVCRRLVRFIHRRRHTRVRGPVQRRLEPKQPNRKKLAEADLSQADLTGVNLVLADLPGASLRGAVLDAADFNTADLTGANLTGASLSDANLRNAAYDEFRLMPSGVGIYSGSWVFPRDATP